MYVCLCKQLSESDLSDFLGEYKSFKDVKASFRGLNHCCGTCLDDLKKHYELINKEEKCLVDYVKVANEIGALVAEKNQAYGDSFGQASKILEVLYPNGIPVEGYRDALAVVRVIDKLFRLANKKDAFGESPWRDICGYAILGIANDEAKLSESI